MILWLTSAYIATIYTLFFIIKISTFWPLCVLCKLTYHLFQIYPYFNLFFSLFYHIKKSLFAIFLLWLQYPKICKRKILKRTHTNVPSYPHFFSFYLIFQHHLLVFSFCIFSLNCYAKQSGLQITPVFNVVDDITIAYIAESSTL